MCACMMSEKLKHFYFWCLVIVTINGHAAVTIWSFLNASLQGCPVVGCHADAQEDDYIPCVKEMICLQRNFEKPHAAANAICRQVNKSASKSKAKAKAKAKA